MANYLATQMPELAAAVPFYGSAAPIEEVPKIRAELLVVLAGEDERINAAWPAYEQALKASGVRYALYQPAGTQHGFNNDTTPRYDAAAAAEAWSRMLALFRRTLREPG
jgi:carboxymethylenebutenolidase